LDWLWWRSEIRPLRIIFWIKNPADSIYGWFSAK
jgi:hypothetical protein